jgi:hypothetical protein
MTVGYTEGAVNWGDKGLIADLFATKFNVEYYEKEIMSNITSTDMVSELISKGQNITIARLPSVNIEDHTRYQVHDSHPGTYSDPITFSIDYAKHFDIPIDKVDQKQTHIPDVLAKYRAHALKEVSEYVQELFFEDISSEANASNTGANAGAISAGFNMGESGSGLAITASTVPSVFARVMAVLGEQNAFQPGQTSICIPYWMNMLVQLSPISNAMRMGDASSTLRTGYIGNLLGLDIYTTNSLYSVSDTHQCFSVMAMNRDAVGYVNQLNEVKVDEPSRSHHMEINGLNVCGWGAVKDAGLAHVYCYNNETSMALV